MPFADEILHVADAYGPDPRVFQIDDEIADHGEEYDKQAEMHPAFAGNRRGLVSQQECGNQRQEEEDHENDERRVQVGRR